MKHNLKLKVYLLLAVAFCLGSFLTPLVRQVFAQMVSQNVIYACVKNSNGALRIVSASDTCTSNETALSWSTDGGSVTTTGTFLTNQLIGYSSTYETFDYRNYDAVNFTSAYFSTAHMAHASFVNAIFVNAAFYSAVMDNSNFSGADFTNATLNSVSFANTNLTGANFSGTIKTDLFWSNTICPDGTNSDSNGNTCEGHLN